MDLARQIKPAILRSVQKLSVCNVIMVIGEVPVVVVSRGEAQGPINMFVYNETNVHMEKLWQCDIKMMPWLLAISPIYNQYAQPTGLMLKWKVQLCRQQTNNDELYECALAVQDRHISWTL